MRTGPLHGVLLDDGLEISLEELCRSCGMQDQWIIALVAEGVLSPRGQDPSNWQFPASAVSLVRTARRLESDLGVNLAGVALALDLLAEIERLSAQVERPWSVDWDLDLG